MRGRQLFSHIRISICLNYLLFFFSTNVVHSDEEKHGQSSNPIKLSCPIHQPTDGTNSESVDYPLSRHNQADPYVKQLCSQSTENQGIMESHRREIVLSTFNKMSLQQPCDSLSRLSQMDEPQESLPGLSSHNHTAQYQSHAVFPNHSGMPREVNHSTDQPQTGRPNNDSESSHYASQEPTSEVVFPTNILHQSNQPVALSSHIPQNFTPNENPSAPKHFTTPTSHLYTTESPDIEITSSTASIYHSLSHLNEEEVQFQTTQPQGNPKNTPLGQLSNSVKSNHQSCVARAPHQARKGKCASNRFKLVTLGPSGSGKTSTVYSLLGADVSCTSTEDTIDRLYACEWELSELLEYIKELVTHHDNELKREKIKLLEETLKEVQDVLKDPAGGLKVIENEAIPEAKLKIVIYDIGRQEIYYDIQFLFLASQDVILLTFNASIGLDDSLTTEHCYEEFQKEYKIGRKETNFQAIKATLNAIYSYCGEKCDKSVSPRIPTVIMVATHAFGLTEEKKREIVSTLFERLAYSPLSDHFPKDLIDPIYFIDNKMKNPEAFEKLKTAAVFAAEFSTTEEQPISFLKFEEEILKMMSQKVYMITKEEALSIAKKVVSEKINDDALEELLQHCLHKGILLHYAQVPTLKSSVFISPQMVSNLVSFVVKTHIYAKFCLTATLRKQFIRFDKFGLLEEALLDDMLGRLKDSKYTKEMVLGFLETFNLAVEVDRNIKFENEIDSYCTPDSGRVFFVPSVLVYNKSKDYLKPNDHIDNVVLFHFPDEFLPNTVFNYLLILTIRSSRENGYSIRW